VQVSALGVPAVLPDPLTPESAERVCQQLHALMRRLRSDARTALVADTSFSEYPDAPVPGPVHLVPYAGVEVPIPARPWICGGSYDRHPGRWTLSLHIRGTKDVVLLGPMIGGEPMRDVFAPAGVSVPAEPGREAYTRKLFGKAPSLFDLGLLAWGLRATDFRCDPADVYPAIRDALALTVIASASSYASDLVAYRGVGIADSWLVRGRRPSGRYALEHHWRREGAAYTLMAETADANLAKAFEALAGHMGEGSAQGLDVKPLPGLCGPMVKLAASPTAQLARTLRARASEARRGDLVRALDFYLEDELTTGGGGR